jgi:hypothetical protein
MQSRIHDSSCLLVTDVSVVFDRHMCEACERRRLQLEANSAVYYIAI